MDEIFVYISFTAAVQDLQDGIADMSIGKHEFTPVQ